MKIIFMGTPDFSVPYLDALCNNFEVVGVYTQPPRSKGRGKKILKSPVHCYAEEYGIPVYCPVSFASQEVRGEFVQLKAELAVVVAYGLILPAEILSAPVRGTINVHTSRLPRWRGAAPIQRAIMAGDERTGIDIIQMDSGLDTGDIIARREVSIDHDIKYQGLHDMMMHQGVELMLETLKNKDFSATPQSETGVTYAHKVTSADGHINWNSTTQEIYNLSRALADNVGIYCFYNDEKLFFADIEIIKQDSPQPKCGIIVNDDFTITCVDGLVRTRFVKRQGKKFIPIKDFLNGYKVITDTKLR